MAKEGNNYTYKEDRKVTLPGAHSSFAIEERDWKRLKEAVNNCRTDSQWFMSSAFCCYGIAGSTFATWISLYSQREIDTVKLILLITTCFTAFLGLVLLFFQLYINKSNKSSIQAIKKEISFIEEGIPNEPS